MPRLANYAVSAKQIQILSYFAELRQVNLKTGIDRSHMKMGKVTFCFQTLISINYIFFTKMS